MKAPEISIPAKLAHEGQTSGSFIVTKTYKNSNSSALYPSCSRARLIRKTISN